MTKEIKFMTKYCLQQTIKPDLKKLMTVVSNIQTRMYGYFTSKSKHRLDLKN